MNLHEIIHQMTGCPIPDDRDMDSPATTDSCVVKMSPDMSYSNYWPRPSQVGSCLGGCVYGTRSRFDPNVVQIRMANGVLKSGTVSDITSTQVFVRVGKVYPNFTRGFDTLEFDRITGATVSRDTLAEMYLSRIESSLARRLRSKVVTGNVPIENS